MTLLLTHDILTDGSRPPSRWALLCHGILGSRRNWRSFGQKLVERHPDLGIVSLDLRNHGDNPPVEGPHTLASCAQDLRRLSEQLDIQPSIAIGHSFGGKVVLEYARALPPMLEQVWVLDSRPEPFPAEEVAQSEVNRVIEALVRLPGTFARRQDVVPALTNQGFSRTLALWMTTNLRRGPDRLWTWRFQLGPIREMIADYYATDLRPVLHTPVPDLTVHVVRAARSDRWPAHVLSWFDTLPAGAPGRLHTLPDSDHWVHVDNPEGLLDIMDGEL